VGKTTLFTYEASRNLEIKRVEAANTDFARTISTIWHPDFLQPSQVWEPNRVTNYSYDARGRTLTRVEQATNDPSGSRGSSAAVIGKRRVWSYLYNSSGQVIKLTGPRTDVADITNYAYDGEGNLATIVNPLGHTTNFSNYDRSGRPGHIVKANGITIEMTYWPRGWLKRSSITASGRTETTEYVYDGVGQLKLVTLADSSTVGYDYDDAHRLTRVTDSLGNKISYSYDLASNRISEEVSDSSNILARKIARVYDALNLLKQQTGGTQ
jgi:YD repeat-containing protein